MKKSLLLLVLSIFLVQSALSQKVDSIKVEQSGDFIKIGYKILNSKPGQIYRVKVLFSVNGGLNTEIKSVSGDAGDQVAGGKSEYWALWDVLKDVEDLRSAEFIVRAELITDASQGTSAVKGGPNTTGWDKKRYNVMFTVLGPGPKGGLRIGVMGSFGVSAQVAFGKTSYTERMGIVTIGGSPLNYRPTDQLALSLDLSKRIVNRNGFQMHLMAGVQRTRITFRNPESFLNNPYQEQKVFGSEIGLAFGVKRFAFSVLAIHFDPGQVEKNKNLSNGTLEAASPLNYFSTSIGIRF